MSQYLLSVHSVGEQQSYESDEEMQAAFKAVDIFNQSLQSSGAWVFAGGLQPAETATVVDPRGDALLTDGPFAESKEQLGGFWIIDVADLDMALKLAEEGSVACGAPVEVRPFQEAPPA